MTTNFMIFCQLNKLLVHPKPTKAPRRRKWRIITFSTRCRSCECVKQIPRWRHRWRHQWDSREEKYIQVQHFSWFTSVFGPGLNNVRASWMAVLQGWYSVNVAPHLAEEVNLPNQHWAIETNRCCIIDTRMTRIYDIRNRLKISMLWSHLAPILMCSQWVLD